MKPPAFEYHRPGEIEEALEILAANGGEAKILAGGQSLVPAMNFRLAQPAVLVDLNRIPDLAYIREEAGALRIGAMTRHSALERSDLISRVAPLVTEAMPHIAHPQIRSRGTAGGSIAHADPAAELPAVMVVLGASLTLRSRTATRSIDASSFFTGLFGTALESDEALLEIQVPPRTARTGWAFDEISRRHGDFALAGAAAALTLDEGGRCSEARVALFGVSDVPVLSGAAADLLRGQEPTPELFRAAAEAAAAELDPPGDIHASGDYRRHLAAVIVGRILPLAAERARSSVSHAASER